MPIYRVWYTVVVYQVHYTVLHMLFIHVINSVDINVRLYILGVTLCITGIHMLPRIYIYIAEEIYILRIFHQRDTRTLIREYDAHMGNGRMGLERLEQTTRY